MLSTAVIGIGFGLFPALRGRRSGFAALRDGARTSGGRTRRVRVRARDGRSDVVGGAADRDRPLRPRGLARAGGRSQDSTQKMCSRFKPRCHIRNTTIPSAAASSTSNYSRRAGAAWRAGRGIHQRAADRDAGVDYRRRGSRTACARPSPGWRQSSVDHAAILQGDGHSADSRPRRGAHRYRRPAVGRRRQRVVRRAVLAGSGWHWQDASSISARNGRSSASSATSRCAGWNAPASRNCTCQRSNARMGCRRSSTRRLWSCVIRVRPTALVGRHPPDRARR